MVEQNVHQQDQMSTYAGRGGFGQVLPPHEGLVDGGSKVEDVVTDSQVVLQAERLQHHSIPDGERQPQLLIGVCWERGKHW